MKQIVLMFCFSCYAILGYTQTTDSLHRELTKEEKKAQKEAARLVAFNETNTLLASKAYVLEANYLSGRNGYRFIAVPSLNFIQVDSSQITIQIGSSNRLGYNGVGGVTLIGKMTSYKCEPNEKRKTFYLKISMLCSSGSYDIFMNVGSSGDATATVTGLYPGAVIYEGNLVSRSKSRVFKGRTTY